MNKTVFILLDACQYEAGTRNLGYLEHLIDYQKGAKYKVKGELPSLPGQYMQHCLPELLYILMA